MELKPMLLSEVWDKSILEDDKKWYQIKENGVRCLVHIKKGKVVGMRNRSNNPILYCFPEFEKASFPFDTAILDTEIVVFKNGKSVFYKGIDQRRSVPTAKVLSEYPATMVVFDVLHLNGETMIMKPYRYRYEKLSGIIISDLVKVAENFEGKELWERVKKENLEGVVIKDPNAMYEVGVRSKQYLKFKNYKITEVKATKTEPNDKGTKIYGTVEIEGTKIDVECQLGGVFGVEEGTTHIIKYLDIYGTRMIQPTKVSREQMEV